VGQKVLYKPSADSFASNGSSKHVYRVHIVFFPTIELSISIVLVRTIDKLSKN
jgi:hypothetical protein